MVTYSTNFMGPVSYDWYDRHNIPFVWKDIPPNKYFKEGGRVKEYEYHCYGGRIDIYGLDHDNYYDGKSEISLPVMKGESWEILTEWLDTFASENVLSLEELLAVLKEETGHEIQWVK